MEFSNYDWKLGPKVQTKIILKRLEIRNETITQNDAGQAGSNGGAERSSNRTQKPGRSTSFTSTQETETNPVDSDSAFNLNSGEIIQELQKVIFDFDPGCSTCSNFILQLSRHIRDTHSTQAPPPRNRPKVKSNPVDESETCPSPTIVTPQRISSPVCHLGSHTPLTLVMRPSDSSDTTTSVRQAPSFEVTDGGLRRSSRERNTINYSDLISGPEPRTTTFLDNSDCTRDEDGHQDSSSLSTGDEMKVEGEIDICENEDPSYILEGDRYEDDGDLSRNNDDLVNNDVDSEAEFRREDSFADDNRKLKCKFCKLECVNNEDLNEHMKSTHSEEFVNPYKCNICKSVKFGTGKVLRSHFEQTHPDTLPHFCKACKKMYRQESNLNKHLLWHRKIDPYKCEYCGRGFRLPHVLEIHLQVHTKEKPHKCEVCGKCFAAKEALTKHKDSHTGKSHTCGKCDQSFHSRDTLLTHSIEIHGGDKLETSTGEKIERKEEEKKRKNYGCGICLMKFFEYEYLSNHLRRCHADVLIKKYECKFCDQKFFRTLEMNEHVKKLHPGQKSFQCKICEKEFTKEHLLLVHSVNHTEEKTVSCTHPDCEKKFKKRNTMNIHLLRHTGIKAYKCYECDKTFATSRYLTHHRTTHTGEKPFMCEVCSKCFSTKTGLDSHAKIHKDDKSHVCKECGKCFTHKGQLTTHSKIHTGVKEHLCEECGASFRLPHQLRAHRKSQAHAISK